MNSLRRTNLFLLIALVATQHAQAQATPLTIDAASGYVAHLLRTQDLVDGFFSRVASRIDSDTEAITLDGGNAFAVDQSFELDLSPGMGPGGVGGPGGPGGPQGVLPSSLAALASTTGKLGVRYFGHVIANNGSKTASYIVLLTGNTDIVLTDAADSKTVTVKQNSAIQYSFVWSKSGAGDKTYASTGSLTHYQASVLKLGTALSLDFSTVFDITVTSPSNGNGTVDVTFDDSAILGPQNQIPGLTPGGSSHAFHVQFKIQDQTAADGSSMRVLRAATYQADGIGLALNLAASDI